MLLDLYSLSQFATTLFLLLFLTVAAADQGTPGAPGAPGPSGSAGSPGDQGLPVSELVSFSGSDSATDAPGYSNYTGRRSLKGLVIRSKGTVGRRFCLNKDFFFQIKQKRHAEESVKVCIMLTGAGICDS